MGGWITIVNDYKLICGNPILIRVPIHILIDLIPSPSPWYEIHGQAPISIDEIRIVHDSMQFEMDCYSDGNSKRWDRLNHLKRIAFLASTKDYEENFITMEFSPEPIIMDGYHRLHAAMFNQETHLTIDCGGYINDIETYFGIIVPTHDCTEIDEGGCSASA